MGNVFHLDFETFSLCKFAKQKDAVSIPRYAMDESTEALMFSIAMNDEKPLLAFNPLWEPPINPFNESGEAIELFEKAILDDSIIYAHNVEFESFISKYRLKKDFGINPPKLENWRCTSVMCRKAGIKSSLADAAKFLGLEDKDSEGVRLINKFSKPITNGKRKGERRLPTEDEDDFIRFGGYCLQDTEVERAVEHKLRKFNLIGLELDSWKFHLNMVHKGIPVNKRALEKAKILVDEFRENATSEFKELVGCNPTQRAVFLGWAQEKGYPFDSMTADKKEQVIENKSKHNEDLIKALELQMSISYAAVKKIDKMLIDVLPDNTVKGALMFMGAERTHRWAGSGMQPQNFKRPTVKHIQEFYEHLKSGKCDLESCSYWGSPLEVLASCVRLFIEPEDVFLQADYSAIEARINPWVCGEKWLIDAFKNKEPIYEIMASLIFDIPINEVEKDGIERFIGKQCVLGCGYQMWVDKFIITCANYGKEVSYELAEKAVLTWRKKHPKIVNSWSTIQKAAINAINNPDKTYAGTSKIGFIRTKKLGFDALVMLLPNKKKLIYPEPCLIKTARGIQIEFYGRLGGTKSYAWGRVTTYGGKLLENAVQCLAGVLMAGGAINAYKQGFDIRFLVHDEALAVKKKGQKVEDFEKALCYLPDWAYDLPLVAEGKEMDFYQK